MSTDTLPEITVMADLHGWLADNGATTGRPPAPLEVLFLMAGVSEALADLHLRGFAHGDLRPETVFFEGGQVRLGDPPAGSDFTRSAYTAPERSLGQPAVPRHDLYALGVLWAKLLAGDLAFELHPGWARELEVRGGIPEVQTSLIATCVGWAGDRPGDAVELTTLLRSSFLKLSPVTATPQARDCEAEAFGALPRPKPPGLAQPATGAITAGDRARMLRELDAIERLLRAEVAERGDRSWDGLWRFIILALVAWVTGAACFEIGADLLVAALLGFIVALVASVPIGKALNAGRAKRANALGAVARSRLREVVRSVRARCGASDTDLPDLVGDGADWNLHVVERVRKMVRSLALKASPGLDVV
jgi:hypothetical protein